MPFWARSIAFHIRIAHHGVTWAVRYSFLLLNCVYLVRQNRLQHGMGFFAAQTLYEGQCVGDFMQVSGFIDKARARARTSIYTLRLTLTSLYQLLSRSGD